LALDHQHNRDFWLPLDLVFVGVEAIGVFFALRCQCVFVTIFSNIAAFQQFFDMEIEMIAGEVSIFLQLGKACTR